MRAPEPCASARARADARASDLNQPSFTIGISECSPLAEATILLRIDKELRRQGRTLARRVLEIYTDRVDRDLPQGIWPGE
jgi:hypothetical protein